MSNRLISLFSASFAMLLRSRLCSYFALSLWTLMLLQITSYKWFHTHIVTNNVVGQMVCELSLMPICMVYTNLVEVWMCLSHWNSNFNQGWLQIICITLWQGKRVGTFIQTQEKVLKWNSSMLTLFILNFLFASLCPLRKSLPCFLHENVWKSQYFLTFFHKSSLMPHDLDINLLPVWPMFFAVEWCHL